MKNEQARYVQQNLYKTIQTSLKVLLNLIQSKPKWNWKKKTISIKTKDFEINPVKWKLKIKRK